MTTARRDVTGDTYTTAARDVAGDASAAVSRTESLFGIWARICSADVIQSGVSSVSSVDDMMIGEIESEVLTREVAGCCPIVVGSKLM